MLRLEYSQRRKSAPATGGSGCSSWPAARSEDSESAGERVTRGVADTLTAASRQWATPQAHDGRRPGADLKSTQGGNLSRDAAAWPTPAARDHKGSLPLDARDRTMDTLDEAAERKFRFSPPGPQTQDGPPSSKARRRLNPLFVEWLMGWPIGWTDCASPGTASCPFKRRMHTELSRLCSRTPEQGNLF